MCVSCALTGRGRHGACKIHHTIGCFNDTDWSAGKPGLVLPAYQAAVHGKASLETCAAACHGAKLSVAGVNDGSDCFCGKAADLAKPAVASRGRPKVGLSVSLSQCAPLSVSLTVCVCVCVCVCVAVQRWSAWRQRALAIRRRRSAVGQGGCLPTISPARKLIHPLALPVHTWRRSTVRA